MKKRFVKSLVLLLMLSLVFVSAVPSFAADTVTTASPAWVETAPTPTPAPAPTTTSAPAPTVKGQVYVVVSGDAFWKIAAKYKLTIKQLAALNPQIKNISMIYVGQKITVAGTAVVPAPATASKTIYQGLGYKVNFRNGPGAFPEEGPDALPVYSFNVAMASATFDANGRILSVFMDGYEVATPNYDGASMPHFTGWPTTMGYPTTDHTALTVAPGTTVTLDAATAEVNGWLTKRQRGDTYGMNPTNDWHKQMDFYQNFFKGKTIPEVKAWFAKYGTAAFGPIKASTTNVADKAKFDALTAAEKAQLADVVSGATMRINDVHGYFLDALDSAYANRVAVTVK